jgi:hypothetical protein
MGQAVEVPDPVYDLLERLSREHDFTRKEAVRHLAREAGHDV